MDIPPRPGLQATMVSVHKHLRGKRMKINDLESENATLRKTLSSLVTKNDQGPKSAAPSEKRVGFQSQSHLENFISKPSVSGPQSSVHLENVISEPSVSRQQSSVHLENFISKPSVPGPQSSVLSQILDSSHSLPIQNSKNSSKIIQQSPYQHPIACSSQSIVSQQGLPHSQQVPQSRNILTQKPPLLVTKQTLQQQQLQATDFEELESFLQTIQCQLQKSQPISKDQQTTGQIKPAGQSNIPNMSHGSQGNHCVETNVNIQVRYATHVKTTQSQQSSTLQQHNLALQNSQQGAPNQYCQGIQLPQQTSGNIVQNHHQHQQSVPLNNQRAHQFQQSPEQHLQRPQQPQQTVQPQRAQTIQQSYQQHLQRPQQPQQLIHKQLQMAQPLQQSSQPLQMPQRPQQAIHQQHQRTQSLQQSSQTLQRPQRPQQVIHQHHQRTQPLQQSSQTLQMPQQPQHAIHQQHQRTQPLQQSSQPFQRAQQPQQTAYQQYQRAQPVQHSSGQSLEIPQQAIQQSCQRSVDQPKSHQQNVRPHQPTSRQSLYSAPRLQQFTGQRFQRPPQPQQKSQQAFQQVEQTQQAIESHQRFQQAYQGFSKDQQSSEDSILIESHQVFQRPQPIAQRPYRMALIPPVVNKAYRCPPPLFRAPSASLQKQCQDSSQSQSQLLTSHNILYTSLPRLQQPQIGNQQSLNINNLHSHNQRLLSPNIISQSPTCISPKPQFTIQNSPQLEHTNHTDSSPVSASNSHQSKSQPSEHEQMSLLQKVPRQIQPINQPLKPIQNHQFRDKEQDRLEIKHTLHSQEILHESDKTKGRHLQEYNTLLQKNLTDLPVDDIGLCEQYITGPLEMILKEEQLVDPLKDNNSSNVNSGCWAGSAERIDIEQSLDVSAFLDLENIGGNSHSSKPPSTKITGSSVFTKRKAINEPILERNIDYPPQSIITPPQTPPMPVPSTSRMEPLAVVLMNASLSEESVIERTCDNVETFVSHNNSSSDAVADLSSAEKVVDLSEEPADRNSEILTSSKTKLLQTVGNSAGSSGDINYQMAVSPNLSHSSNMVASDKCIQFVDLTKSNCSSTASMDFNVAKQAGVIMVSNKGNIPRTQEKDSGNFSDLKPSEKDVDVDIQSTNDCSDLFSQTGWTIESGMLGTDCKNSILESLNELDAVVEYIDITDEARSQSNRIDKEISTPKLVESHILHVQSEAKTSSRNMTDQFELNAETENQLYCIEDGKVQKNITRDGLTPSVETDNSLVPNPTEVNSLESHSESNNNNSHTREHICIFMPIDDVTGRITNPEKIPEECPLCYMPMCPSIFTVNVHYDMETVCTGCNLTISLIWGNKSDIILNTERPCPKSKKKKVEKC